MHKFTRECTSLPVKLDPMFHVLFLVTCVIFLDIACRVLKRFGVAHQTNTKFEADEMRLISEFLQKK